MGFDANEKGMVATLETLFIFLGWMLVLSQVWSVSGEGVKQTLNEWKQVRAQEASARVSDYLVLQHHPTPWRGCAVYDAAAKRVRVNEIEEACLEQLEKETPPEKGVRVSLRMGETKKVFFDMIPDANGVCWTHARGVWGREAHVVEILEVRACV